MKTRDRQPDAIILDVLREKAPRGETITMSMLRKFSGLHMGRISAALQALRYAGKIEWDRIALRPSLWVVPDALATALSEDISLSANVIKTIEGGVATEGVTPAAPMDRDAMWFLFPETYEGRAVSLSRAQAALLLEEIDDYCVRTGTDRGKFGRMVLDFPGFVGLLRKRLTVRSDKAAAVRAAMAWAPDGINQLMLDAARRDWLAAQADDVRAASLAAAPGSDVLGDAAPLSPLAAQIAQEASAAAERRSLARMAGGVHRAAHLGVNSARPFDGTDLQALALDGPADAVQMLQRRWGDLWPRLVAQARAHGMRPVPHMVAILERALDEVDDGEMAA